MALPNPKHAGVGYNIGSVQPTSTLQGIHAHRRTCPRCQGALTRVKRRYVDRLISIVIPVHRYRCIASSCGWKGNLRVRRE